MTPEELKKFYEQNPNLTTAQKEAIGKGQRNLTPKEAPYAAAEKAYQENLSTYKSTTPQRQNTDELPPIAAGIIKNQTSPSDSYREMRPPAVVAISASDVGPKPPKEEISSSFTPVYGMKEKSIRSPYTPVLPSDSNRQTAEGLARITNPTGPTPQFLKGETNPSIAEQQRLNANKEEQNKLEGSSPIDISRGASAVANSGNNLTATSKEVDPMSPMEHDLAAIKIIQDDRNKRIAQRSLVPQTPSIDIDRLEKIGNIARFEADSAAWKADGSKAKALARQSVMDSYKPVIDALIAKGTIGGDVEKQRLAARASVMGNENNADAKVASQEARNAMQESRNAMLERLGKERLDTMLQVANITSNAKPRYSATHITQPSDEGPVTTPILYDNQSGAPGPSITPTAIAISDQAGIARAKELKALKEKGTKLNPEQEQIIAKYSGQL